MNLEGVLQSKVSQKEKANMFIQAYVWTLEKWYAAANSLQSCPTLCDPIAGSPPGSPVPGILQARTLEWGAIAFSEKNGIDDLICKPETRDTDVESKRMDTKGERWVGWTGDWIDIHTHLT